MIQYLQVVTTTATKDEAEKIARALIDARLAACVQIAGPITSLYRWQGKVETSQEWQCVAKSRAELFEAVAAAIRQMHPYELPEIVAVSLAQGTPDYLRWIDEQTTREA